jgi:glycosyltransferase involved in cell wall biosynthesis
MTLSHPATICFVIIGLDYAGAEIQLVEVIRRLRVRGWRLFVVSLLTPAAFVRELSALGVHVVSLDLEKGAPLDLQFLMRFLAVMRRIRPDVVHGHMVHSNLLARLAAFCLRIPVAVATVHSTDEGGRSRMWLYRLTEPWGSVTTSVSAAGREMHLATRASSPDRIVVLPNGIDQERFRPDPVGRARVRAELHADPDTFVWLSVTRFAPPKDPLTLLKAMAHLPGRSLLWLVGQGEERGRSEALVQEVGLQERVRFLGVRTDIPDLLAAADAFVLSSRSEAMPITLLEAASAGLLCVASDVGAVRELVLDGKTGFVVPPADPDGLCSAMLRTEQLGYAGRASMGGQGREWVGERYGLDAIVDQWEALYYEHLRSPVDHSVPR